MLSTVTEWSWGTCAVSRYKVDARQLLSTVTEVSTGRGGNPGLSPRRLLSNVQRINAKTVTSLLIIPSVLAVGMLKLSGYNRGQIGSGVYFFLSGYTKLSRNKSFLYSFRPGSNAVSKKKSYPRPEKLYLARFFAMSRIIIDPSE